MKIVTVIPISRGISKDSLTYFTKNDISTGSIVSIPIRKKTIYGLVTKSELAEDVKSKLRSLPYPIKKVENIEVRSFLSDAFLKAAQKIADYNAASIGSVLSALIPNAILDESESLPYQKTKDLGETFHETLLIQSDNEERYAAYKSLIREEFAKGHSVFFCLPTTEDLLNAKAVLERGIEKYAKVFHSGLPKKNLISLWKEASQDNHPLLLIGTGSFLSLPKDDLGTIIIDRESSRAYKMQARPWIDVRVAAEFLAKEMNIKLVLGDDLLRVETLWEEKNGKYAELSPLKFRSLTPATLEVVNLRGPQDMKKKEFQIFSDKLRDLIKNSIENNERTFLFCGRKGLFPITMCSDCGTVVTCKNCSAPVVLYKKKEGTNKGNLFVCHHCGERREAKELCKHCGGWRLNPSGIGIERVFEEVENLFGHKAKVYIFDKDHIKTHKQAVKVRDMFYSGTGVMLGTEMALTYLNQKIENTAVVSMDAYFSIPDFQINEKIFHILLSLRAITEKNMLIQTRQENTKIFDYALQGNLVDFYRDEIDDRKSIGYPPFTTYIKITLEGEKNSVKREMAEALEFMKPYDMQVFDAWNPGGEKKFSIHGLISLERGKWVDPELLSKLKALPPQYMVRIDPVTLL